MEEAQSAVLTQVLLLLLHNKSSEQVRHGEDISTVVCVLMFTNLAVIIFFPLISQNRANDCAGVLNHHLPSLNVPFAEKAATMNFRSEKDYRRETVTCISAY